jgi:hypothetical protein
VKFLTLIIIAIIGITILVIWRIQKKEDDELLQRKNDMMIASGLLIPEGERLRRELSQGFAPFEAYRDPELEKLYMDIPAKVYYYSEANLDPETKNLLFGTGTNPVYPRRTIHDYYHYYPHPTAPAHISQLMHNVSKPARYDYVSKYETMMV